MINWINFDKDSNNKIFENFPDNHIHIWRLKFTDKLSDASFDLGLSVLDESSRKSALRFKFKHLQDKYIQTQFTLRYLLSNYLNIEPQDIEFSKNNHGKPYLALGNLKNNSKNNLKNNSNLMFNISHSNDYALFAFVNNNLEIGIDIEKISDKPYLELAERFFSKKEFELLSNLQSNQQKIGFFRLWTRKESYIKAIGEGLSHSLSAFSMNIDEKAEFLDHDLAKKWHIESILLEEDGYCGSLVCEKKNTKIEKICFIDTKNML